MNGYCTNLPTNCPKAASKELIPMSAPDSRCPECGSTLMPAKASGTGSKDNIAKIIVGMLLLVLLVGGGYLATQFFTGGNQTGKPATTSTQPAPPAATSPSKQLDQVAVVGPAGKTGSTETYVLRLSGSNTIGASLAPRLVEAWLASQGASGVAVEQRRKDGQLVPETLVRGQLNGTPVAVEIRAHGSGEAFKDLANGSADIGMASRPVSSEEKAVLSALGDLTGPRSEHVIALDGIAVIVSERSPMQEISRQDLARVFSGEVSDWSQLKAGNGPVHVYARDDKSGTFDTFKHLVLGKKPLVPSARRFEDSVALEAEVAKDPLGIGFVGLPYVKNSRALPISDGKSIALAPTVFTVKKEDYPLSRRLYLYTAAVPSNDRVGPFVRFVQSEAGQKVVKAVGFVDQNLGLAPQPQSAPLVRHCTLSGQWPRARDAYCRLVADRTDLGTNFRFRTGSAELDNRALQDLQRVLKLLSENPDRKLALVGFADSSGQYPSNIKLSEQRADSVKKALSTLGITGVETYGFGPELPVADNAAEDGRERNRRVEVWVK
jgi:phosphate transport system substrate-binding protein